MLAELTRKTGTRMGCFQEEIRPRRLRFVCKKCSLVREQANLKVLCFFKIHFICDNSRCHGARSHMGRRSSIPRGSLAVVVFVESQLEIHKLVFY